MLGTLRELGSDGQPDFVTQQQQDGVAQVIQTGVEWFVCPSRGGNAVYPILKNGYKPVSASAIPDFGGRNDYAGNAGDRYNANRLGQTQLALKRSS